MGEIITNLAVKERIAVTNSFRGEDYFVYPIKTGERPSQLMVYFPVSARNSLPNVGEFKCRVIGIVSYTPNLPLGARQGTPFFIRAVSLFLPYEVA